jgi:hypothetical protein
MDMTKWLLVKNGVLVLVLSALSCLASCGLFLGAFDAKDAVSDGTAVIVVRNEYKSSYKYIDSVKIIGSDSVGIITEDSDSIKLGQDKIFNSIPSGIIIFVEIHIHSSNDNYWSSGDEGKSHILTFTLPKNQTKTLVYNGSDVIVQDGL